VKGLRDEALETIAAYPEARIEYLDVTDPETLEPVTNIEGPVLIAAAMWLGSTRLIDNVVSYRQP
jgi:pantothenate synthetase